MSINDLKIIYFLGPSKSGKTTSIERIIEGLTTEGVACATIKFIHHPTMNIDPAGKDSSRHRNAGALYTINIASTETAIMITRSERETIFDAKNIILNSKDYLPPIDILLCESLNSPPPHSLVFLSANTSEDVDSYSKKIPDCTIIGIIGNIANSKTENNSFLTIPILSALKPEELAKLISIIRINLSI